MPTLEQRSNSGQTEEDKRLAAALTTSFQTYRAELRMAQQVGSMPAPLAASLEEKVDLIQRLLTGVLDESAQESPRKRMQEVTRSLRVFLFSLSCLVITTGLTSYRLTGSEEESLAITAGVAVVSLLTFALLQFHQVQHLLGTLDTETDRLKQELFAALPESSQAALLTRTNTADHE